MNELFRCEDTIVQGAIGQEAVDFESVGWRLAGRGDKYQLCTNTPFGGDYYITEGVLGSITAWT